MHLTDYLAERDDLPQIELFRYLHNLLTTYPGVKGKIHYNTPFYTAKRWLCYVAIQKKGGVELNFVQAHRFRDHLEYLDFKKRKQVAGITFIEVSEINEEIIDLLMNEALKIDAQSAR